MSVLYESSSPDLESQFGSPHGFHHHIVAGHLKEGNIDRSARLSASPLIPSFDMVPTSVSMDHNFSESSYSDSEIAASWNSFPYHDTESISPMSNFQDFNTNWHSVNSFTESQQAMNIPASQAQQTTDNFCFDFSQNSFPNGQQALNSKASKPLFFSSKTC
jgi:hypothetical protein